MANRLISETSPYLLQHAENPVDWWPWCEEALDLARAQDKPILLSVGYAACHWCHVMEKESFEDERIAGLMNRHFINIKVDREERPDIDQIYQSAYQMLNRRSGGWPLTMFLTPDGTPFMGGTYFPNMARYRLPAFPEVLAEVADTFRKQRKGIEEQNAALRAELARAGSHGGATHHSDLGTGPLDALRALLEEEFDKRNGGFGDAPKFPRASDLEFLLHRYIARGDAKSRDMALLTLSRMAEGGLYDHIGGGFFRYSTDEEWQIPHFEKMLCDNGMLLRLYADGWLVSGEPRFRDVVEETVAWVQREMCAPDGGFHSSLDADSEGSEGRFYVWDRKEVSQLLEPGVAAVMERHFGLDRPPNFEDRHWHLCVAKPLDKVAASLGMSIEEASVRLERGRRRLFEARSGRARPGLDHKVLTSWNGLMIAGMAHAARVFARNDWLVTARAAMAFVRRNLWRNGRLLATSAGGEGRLNAYLDDHVFLIDALIELMQVDFDPLDLEFAEELADALLDSFENRGGGGFFFTRHDHEALIQRPVPIHDHATPSGNGVAVRVFGKLGHMTGEIRYLQAAERALQAFHGALQRSPVGCASLAVGLAEHLDPPSLVVVRGKSVAIDAWRRELAGDYRPDVLCLGIPAGLRNLPPVLDRPAGDRVNATVCIGVECRGPFFDCSEAKAALGNKVLHR